MNLYLWELEIQEFLCLEIWFDIINLCFPFNLKNQRGGVFMKLKRLIAVISLLALASVLIGKSTIR